MQRIILQDCLEYMKAVEDNTFDCVVTSPPYNKGSGQVVVFGIVVLTMIVIQTIYHRKNMKIGNLMY